MLLLLYLAVYTLALRHFKLIWNYFINCLSVSFRIGQLAYCISCKYICLFTYVDVSLRDQVDKPFNEDTSKVNDNTALGPLIFNIRFFTSWFCQLYCAWERGSSETWTLYSHPRYLRYSLINAWMVLISVLYLISVYLSCSVFSRLQNQAQLEAHVILHSTVGMSSLVKFTFRSLNDLV